MRSRKTLRILTAVVVLGFVAALFVVVIWIPLYGRQQKADWAVQQDEPPIQAEITRDEPGGTRSWSLKDKQALQKLQAGLQSANYTAMPDPKIDQTFRLRIRRSDSRVDEYEVQLDERGREHDMLYVVRRSGGGAVYGSAFKTPELRSALQQLIKEQPEK
jgi:hypothetical protein